MNTKIVMILLGALIMASVHLAIAQEPKKIPQIGHQSGGSSSAAAARIDAFRQGLRELGYTEGKNIGFEYRYAEGNLDRIPDLIAELVRLKVNVIVSGTVGVIWRQ